jgi:hypothetical protein
LNLLQKRENAIQTQLLRLDLTPHLSPRQKLTQIEFSPTKRTVKRKETIMAERDMEKAKAEAQAQEKEVSEKAAVEQKKYDGGKIPRAKKS